MLTSPQPSTPRSHSLTSHLHHSYPPLSTAAAISLQQHNVHGTPTSSASKYDGNATHHQQHLSGLQHSNSPSTSSSNGSVYLNHHHHHHHQHHNSNTGGSGGGGGGSGGNNGGSGNSYGVKAESPVVPPNYDYMNNCIQSGYFGGTFGPLAAASHAAAAHSSAELGGYHHQHNVIQAAKLMASS